MKLVRSFAALVVLLLVGSSTAEVVDGVLTVDIAETRAFTDAELFAITNAESTVSRILKTGSGDLNLTEPLAYRGGWEISSGDVHVFCSSNAFGSGTAEGAKVEVHAYQNNADVYLDVSTVLDIPFLIHANDTDSLGIIAKGATSNVFAQAVSFDSRSFSPCLQSQAVIVFEGGVIRSGGGGGFSPIQTSGAGSTGRVVIRTTPGSFGNLWLDGDAPIVEFAVNGTKIVTGSTATFRGGAQVVFNSSRPLSNQDVHLAFSADWTGQLDLNGATFMSQALKPSGMVQTTGKITSSTPGGVLDFYQNSDFTNCQVDVAGYASLIKQGNNLFAVDRPFSSTGSLTVKKGRMAFLQNATWSGCSDVTVSGGTLELDNSNVFNRKASIKVTDGKLLLGEGVVQVCSEFFVNGVRQSDGFYGAAGSGGTVLDCFESGGKGRLVVGEPGLTLLIR